MEMNQALAIVRQACEAHAANWQQHQLMQEALSMIEAAMASSELDKR